MLNVLSNKTVPMRLMFYVVEIFKVVIRKNNTLRSIRGTHQEKVLCDNSIKFNIYYQCSLELTLKFIANMRIKCKISRKFINFSFFTPFSFFPHRLVNKVNNFVGKTLCM